MAVRKVLIAAIICAGLYCSSARSADISLTSQLSQSAEFNSNYFLQTHPPGLITVPISSLRVDGVARTPTSRLFGTADLSYQTYAGPGVADFIVAPALNKGARVALEQTEKADPVQFGGFLASTTGGTATASSNGHRHNRRIHYDDRAAGGINTPAQCKRHVKLAEQLDIDDVHYTGFCAIH